VAEGSLRSGVYQLLWFVYNQTEPMIDAHEGDVLDFSTVSPFKALPPPPEMSKSVRKKAMDLSRRLLERNQRAVASARLEDGPIDDVFIEGLPRDEELPTASLVIGFRTRPSLVELSKDEP
jgi:hypothetical protein